MSQMHCVRIWFFRLNLKEVHHFPEDMNFVLKYHCSEPSHSWIINNIQWTHSMDVKQTDFVTKLKNFIRKEWVLFLIKSNSTDIECLNWKFVFLFHFFTASLTAKSILIRRETPLKRWKSNINKGNKEHCVDRYNYILIVVAAQKGEMQVQRLQVAWFPGVGKKWCHGKT